MGRKAVKFSIFYILGLIVSCIGLAIIVVGWFFPYYWQFSFGYPTEETIGLQQNPVCAITHFLIGIFFVGLFMIHNRGAFYLYQIFFIVFIVYFVLFLFTLDWGWDFGSYLNLLGFSIIEISSFIWKVENDNQEILDLVEKTKSHN